jgi:hypothetical protein
MLLVTIKPTPISIWRWCSGFLLLLGFVSAFLGRRRFSELGRAGIKNLGAYRYVFYMTGGPRHSGRSLAGLQCFGLGSLLVLL